MPIPIANIYYLLCYAWDEFAPRQMADVQTEQFPDTLHLFAHLLAVGIRTLHRQGLERGYVAVEEATSILRGRILMGRTLQLRPTQRQKAFCTFDAMNVDILSNQILKATIRTLLDAQTLKGKPRIEVGQALQLLPAVSDLKLTARLFHEVRIHQNNRLYSFLMNICRFLYESLEAQEKLGPYRFRDVDRDGKRMRRIFEKFVRNFFLRRQSAFRVRRDRMKWDGSAVGNSDLNLLPQMETDVTLRSLERTVIIECKYAESLYENRFFKEKFRAQHLYQLCSYLRNLEAGPKPDDLADGILLYPTCGIALDQSYQLQRHHVRIKTIDLNQTWPLIEYEMMTLLRPTSMGGMPEGTP
jgi:5-methylcytosine-specific restriction enzyme subunit McrC